jgi:hypothetical protein
MLNLLAGLSPQQLLVGFALLGVLLALPLELAALRRLRRAQVARGTLLLLGGAAVLLLGLLAAVVGADLRTYARLAHEQEAATIVVRQRAPQDFELTLRTPGKAPRAYRLRGDEWQLDARVLKWRPIGVLLGFDTLYRLERLSGRYAQVADDRSSPRTVYPLASRALPGVDLWPLLRRYHADLPFADTLYGGAVYMPMADGARYAVSVSASGLVARATNDEARRAVANWR